MISVNYLPVTTLVTAIKRLKKDAKKVEIIMHVVGTVSTDFS